MVYVNGFVLLVVACAVNGLSSRSGYVFENPAQYGTALDMNYTYGTALDMNYTPVSHSPSLS